MKSIKHIATLLCLGIGSISLGLGPHNDPGSQGPSVAAMDVEQECFDLIFVNTDIECCIVDNTFTCTSYHTGCNAPVRVRVYPGTQHTATVNGPTVNRICTNCSALTNIAGACVPVPPCTTGPVTFTRPVGNSGCMSCPTCPA